MLVNAAKKSLLCGESVLEGTDLRELSPPPIFKNTLSFRPEFNEHYNQAFSTRRKWISSSPMEGWRPLRR
jgi:hypothetical protein